MNVIKGLTRRGLAAVLLVVGVMAAACVPIRQEASWPALELIGDQQDILVAYNDRVVMVDPTDGEPVKLRNADGEVRLDDSGNARLWDFRGPENTQTQFYAAPILLDADTLLIPSQTERLFDVDLPTARPITSEGEPLPGQVVSTPVLVDDLLYMGLADGGLVALDKSDLSVKWRVDTDRGVWSKPLVVDGVLYFSSLDHYLYAVDATTGEEKWKLDLEGAAPSAPVYYDGHLYTGSFARKLFQVSLDGKIVSEFTTHDWVWGTPAVVDGVLYAGDLSGMVYALDVSDGGFRQVWQAEASSKAIRPTPLVYNEYVIVGSRDQKIYWLSREDGSTFFSRDVGGEVLSDFLVIQPSDTTAVAEPLLVVGTPTNEEILAAFTLQSGERAWTYSYS